MKTAKVAKKPSRKKSSRPTVGYPTAPLEINFVGTMWSGAVVAAEEQDANLITFIGGQLRAPGFQRQANVLYDLVGPDNIDGLVINSMNLSWYVSPEEMKQFIAGYQPLAMTDIGFVEGLPGVAVDNEAGMRELVSHLIEVHGYRRIVLVRGMEGHPDADARYRAYAETLAEHDIALDPQLVTPYYSWGPDWEKIAEEGLRVLLDERKLRPGKDVQVIIGNSDNWAIAALNMLQERGIHVPQELAVVGYDDLEICESVTPPLSTVHQPVAEPAHWAVEALLGLLEGEQLPERTLLPTHMVIRQSCGCTDPAIIQAGGNAGSGLAAAPRAGQTLGDSLAAGQTEILAEMKAGASTTLPDAQARQLLESFTSDIGAGSDGAFLRAWDNILQEGMRTGGRLGAWHGVLSGLRRRALPHLVDNPQALSRAEALWQQARVAIGEAAWRAQAYQQMLGEQRAQMLSEIGQALITTFDVTELMDVLAKGLPRLGIPACYLSLYENPEAPGQGARLILAYDERGRLELESGGRGFPSSQLVPPGMLPEERRYSLIVEPLYFRENQLGFVLFELGPHEGALYDALRSQISSALYGATLVRQVEQRAGQLEQAYHKLQEQGQMLLITEKMASLGRLTAGIAHEMNTPLAAVRATLVNGEELVKEYEASIGDVSVTDKDHREIARELHSALQLADKAAERAVGFVRGIKSQTRDMALQEHILFDAVVVIRDTLLLLGNVLRETKCELSFEPSAEEVKMHGSPGRLAQVITNLVNNAAEASQSEGGGQITLRLSQRAGEVELLVSDRGSGIAPDVLAKIYDPLFTTKPFGSGTGLGLTIVHDIVTGEFGGSIEVTSDVGMGSTFTVHFPVKA